MPTTILVTKPLNKWKKLFYIGLRRTGLVGIMNIAF